MDNEFLLQDRIQKIKQINEKYDLENNGYISFSGGKDSTIVSALVDLAIPDNNIPRVFINTGIEYKMIVDFVERERERDPRILIIQPKQNIKNILDSFGYPFKSKEHSHKWECWKKGQKSKWVLNYLNDGARFTCPKVLRYQFTPDFNIKISDKCCYKLKKEPVKKWEIENEKSIAILGIRTEEGGQRANAKQCTIFDKNGLRRFKPLNVVSDDFENWFIDKYNIKLCELYYPPFNFKRTGCKGCPYSIDLEKQLYTMRLLIPNEAKQCEAIWKPIYQEYRRLGYRLKKDNGQRELF